MKQCSFCKQTKDFSEFYPRKDSKDGFRADCKDCCQLRAKGYYKGNHAHARARIKKWQQKRYFVFLCQRSNDRHNHEYKLKPFDLWKIAHKQKLICPYTGDKLNITNISVDHIIPVSKGGSNHPSNIQLIHRAANNAKSFLTELEFLNLCRKIASNHPL